MALSGGAVGRVLPALVLLASAYYAIWGGEYTALDLRRLRRQQAIAEDSVTIVQRQVDSLRLVAQRLEKDPATIERVARERFGMIRPGEVLYRFVRVGTGRQASAAAP